MKSIRNKWIAFFVAVIVLLISGAVYLIASVHNNYQEIQNIRYAQAEDQKANHDDLQPQGLNVLSSLADRSERLIYGIGIYIFLVCVLIISWGYWIVSFFNKSFQRPLNLINGLVSGDTSLHENPTADEFGVITKATNLLSSNLKQSSLFAHSIGEGNFDFNFTPGSEKDVLGNALLQMRDKLKNITETDKKRNWTTEGLALFSGFIRRDADQVTLSNLLISELVKYTKSNQGGLFILNRDNDSDLYLELVACYAYDRTKHLSKRINIGEGLLGQCYQEGDIIYLAQIPKDYITITSGLGEATPKSLLMVPLKVNGITEGIIELASFTQYEPHEIEFVSRVGEIIASAIGSSRINDRTKKMLEESQQQAEEMRAQEEEMRQNMEEMQATQELMERQSAEMKKIQSDLELEKSMFHVLMEFLTDRITYKDTESRILRINKAKAERLNMKAEEVVGKTDYDFFPKDHAEKAMREEKALINSGKPLMDIEEKLEFTNGDIAWVSTSRIPFKNEHGLVNGMFIITKDITKLKNAELAVQSRDQIIRQLLPELNLFHYKVNREGIIYEVGEGHGAFTVLSTIQSKPLHEVFPEVSACLQSENKEGQVFCTAEYQTSSTSMSLAHHIFKDLTQDGSLWIFVRQSNES